MSWDSTLVKIASYAVRGTLRTVGGRVPKDRYRALLTGVVAGVLSEHPDLSPAQAARSAESATGDKAAPELVGHSASAGGWARDEGSAQRTSKPGTRKRGTRSAGTTRRKTTKKAAKKATRKPAASKRTTRKSTGKGTNRKKSGD